MRTCELISHDRSTLDDALRFLVSKKVIATDGVVHNIADRDIFLARVRVINKESLTRLVKRCFGNRLVIRM